MAPEHRDIEITGGNGDRSHQRRVRPGVRRLIDLLPSQRGSSLEYQSLHGGSSLGSW
jgi:hypothetical protein